MMVKFFCPRWGSEALPWPAFFEKIKRAGYDGVEWAIGASVLATEIAEVCRLAEKEGLKIIAQHYDTYEADFSKHIRLFNEWLEKIKPFSFYKTSSQTGKDHFPYEENEAIIRSAGCNVIHETHRGKFSFAAHVTKEYLQKIPGLRITLDVSHWCCVAESFLEDQEQAMELAIERTDHIHARVGYPEGPQVPDPRTAEWNPALLRHLDWWDRVVARNPAVTITTEFGPFPYMVNVPRSGEPVADQWQVNVFMMNLLKNRYRQQLT